MNVISLVGDRSLDAARKNTIFAIVAFYLIAFANRIVDLALVTTGEVNAIPGGNAVVVAFGNESFTHRYSPWLVIESLPYYQPEVKCLSEALWPHQTERDGSQILVDEASESFHGRLLRCTCG
jgi:hypothetical protein